MKSFYTGSEIMKWTMMAKMNIIRVTMAYLPVVQVEIRYLDWTALLESIMIFLKTKTKWASLAAMQLI